MTRRHGLTPLGAGLAAVLAVGCGDSAPTGADAAASAPRPDAPVPNQVPTLGRAIYGLDDRNTLVVFDGDRPTDVLRRVPITGVGFRSVSGIDFRPNDSNLADGDQTGLLYALSGAEIFTIDLATGAATLRSTLSGLPVSTGVNTGFGFNPVADRLRLHIGLMFNVRANVETPMTVVDAPLAYAAGDVNAGRRPSVVATAYTNSVTPAPASTELFAIDAAQDVLVKLNSPNDGQLRTVGRLVIDNSELVGFDIPGRATDRTGYATFTPPNYNRSFLYRINLDNAAREPIAPVGHDRPIVSIAIDDVGSAEAARMSFFVTSAGPGDGANLGGLAGADRSCQQLATAVGAGGRTWRAYLSTSATDGQPAVNARDRIGQGPWYNVRGALVARTLDELHAEAPSLTKETALTERGDVVPGSGESPNQHDILTGSRADGTAFSGDEDRTCRNWTSNAADGSAQVGHHDRRGTGGNPPNSWNSAHPSRGCGQANLRTTGGAGLFYCFAP